MEKIVIDSILESRKFYLGASHKFYLIMTYISDIDSRKDYVKDIIVKYDDTIVARDYIETIDFFSTIDLYLRKNLTAGLKGKFFTVSERTIDKKKHMSLECNFAKKTYIEYPEAKTMWTIYNEAKIGKSFASVLGGETIFKYSGPITGTSQNRQIITEDDISNVTNSLLNNQKIPIDERPYFDEKMSKLFAAARNR